MATKTAKETARELIARYGRTYAQDAGIKIGNTPKPLYQLLVLASLLSARITAKVATGSARALFDAGMSDPIHMADATWQERVDALGVGHYRRYDEHTATQLGEGAERLLDRYGGDLRKLRDEAAGDLDACKRLLREVMPGLGPVGADIFLREAQGVWPEAAPYFDGKTVQGAERLGLPKTPRELAELTDRDQYPTLAAALVRSALDKHVAEDVREHTGHG
jgi:hypothetical protein